MNDTQLYGKFLVEWDRVISDLEKFVDEVQLFHIVQAFLGPAEADPAEEKAKEALERVLNQIPNILTPRNQMSLLDPKTTKRYTDGTLRGAPDIKILPTRSLPPVMEARRTTSARAVPSLFLFMPSINRELSCSDRRAEAPHRSGTRGG